MNNQEALKMAGYNLDGVIADVEKFDGFDDVCLETIKRVRSVIEEALSEQEPAREPISFEMDELTEEYYGVLDDKTAIMIYGGNRKYWSNKIYTHPHQWQGLTDDEIDKIADIIPTNYEHDFARAIEQALKEKNHGN